MDLSDVRGASSPCVAVWLLGPFRVVRSGVDAAIAPSRKVRALVAYLVMAPRPVCRAKLCELFWDAPNDPRGELRWCLSKISRSAQRRIPRARENRKRLGVRRCVDH